MKLQYFVIYFLFFPISIRAIPSDPNILQKLRSLKSDQLKTHKDNLLKLQQQLRQIRHAPLSSFPENESRRRAIDDMRQKIKDINDDIGRIDANDFNLIIPVFKPSFAVGDIGKFGEVLCYVKRSPYTFRQFLKIVSIVNDENAIVEFYIDETNMDNPPAADSKRPAGVRVIHSIKSIWLRGINTKDLTTGKNITPHGFFIISGTQDYRTPIGAKETVFVFEPFKVP